MKHTLIPMRFLLIIVSLFVLVKVQAQSCDVQIVTTGVTCNGSSDGTAKVVVNGQASGNPQGCLSAESAPASYTTACTRTYSDNTGNVEINPGEQVCLSSSNFTGGIQAKGGTLVITGNATPSQMNLSTSNPGFTLVVIGTAHFSSLNLFGNSTVKNYGTLHVPSVGFNGTLENNGALHVTGNLDINSPYGNFTNRGIVTISQSFNNLNTTLNGGTITVSGSLNNNSQSILNNVCKISVAGNFNNNTKTINRGTITVGGATAMNGSSMYQGYAGSVLSTGSTTIDGIVQGMSTSCASIKVAGGAIVNSTAVFSGAIDYCAPNGSTNTGSFVSPSTKNCSCTSVSATYAWQSPLSGTADVQNNLAAGITYSVVVSAQGCAPVTKTFTIQTPAVLAATITPNGLSATVSVTGGTAPYTYAWSGNQSTLSSVSYAASGTYTLQLTDSKGCTISKTFTLTAPPAGNCVITVETKNPTCAGSKDGSATVYLNGNILGTGVSIGGGTQTPAGCAAVQTSTYSCTTGCTQTVSDNNANITVNAGQQVCLTANAYTGNIHVNGGTLIVCGKATPQNINYNTNGAAFTLVVNGELVLSNLNLPVNSTLKNYGKVTFTNSVSYNGRVENYGIMLAAGDFNNNSSSGIFFNYSSLTVNGNLNNNVTGTNSGVLTISGNLHINGGSTFTNNCTIQIGNEFINNAAVTNSGKISVNQWTRLNGSSTTNLSAGALISTQHIMIDGTVTGTGSGCSALKVTGQSTINGSGKLQGQVSMCPGTGPTVFTGTVVSPASRNCSCIMQPLEYSSPLQGMNNPYLGLSPDTYTVTVQTEGCPLTVRTFTIKDPDPIKASVAVSGKTATVTASGGQGSLIYTWSDGSSGTSASHTFVNNGTYQVTVSDTKQCSKTITFSIPVTSTGTPCCSKLVVEYVEVNQVRFTSSCSSEVTILTSSGAAAGNTRTRPRKDSIVQVQTGEGCVYEILVKGSGNPVYEDNPEVNPLTLTGIITPESCAGKKDGAIQLTISGGSDDYSISNNYNTLINSRTIGSLGAGIIQVQVYDNKTGFYKTASFTIGLKPANTYQLVANSFTSGGDVASVKIVVSGSNSTANTTVDWGSLSGSGFGPVSVPTWIYTSSGFVTATISESWACPVTLALPAVAASCPVTLTAASTDASCAGSATGSAAITNLPAGSAAVWSGTPYYSTGSSVSGLAAGTYRADVFSTLPNGNTCKAGSVTATVGQPAKLQVKVVQQGATTTYAAQVSGGVSPYSYQWSNGSQAITSVLSGGGFYQLDVLDSKGCRQQTQLYVPVGPCAKGVELDITQLSCAAGNTGKVSVSSAISGASYYWTSALPATPITNNYNPLQENLGEGLYVVSVKGWNPDCIIRTGVRLKKPAAMTAVNRQVGNTVTIVVSNGTPNYKVVWRFDKQEAESRNDLTPGVEYTVDITDSKDCKLEYTFTFDPCALNPVVALVQMQDKKASPQVRGGTAPYAYLWTAVTVGSNALSAPASAVQTNLEGEYRLTVTDARGCTGTVQVTGPNCGMNGISVVPTATSCATACDGKAVLSGTIPAGAVIRWDSLATAFSLVNACTGNHSVQIQNAQGCYIKKDVFIPGSGGACPDPNPETPKPGNCTLDAVLQTATSKLSKQCFDEQGFIDIKITGGFAPFRMKWDVKRSGTTVTETFATDKEDYSNAQPGVYTFYITDQRGCSKTVSATVTGPARALTGSVNLKPAVCAENYASFHFEISGGAGPYSIRETQNPASPAGSGVRYTATQTGGIAGVDLSPAQAGSYSYEITDALGCKLQQRIHLPAVAPESIRFSGSIIASQTRLKNGQSALLSPRTVSGYTVTWNDQATAPVNRTVSQAGTYAVTYSRTGCQSYTRSITVTAALPGDSSNLKSVLCIASQPFEIPVDTVDHCVEYKRLSAEAFARYRYELYVAAQKDSIRNKYVKAVMGSADESLTMGFTDKEEHYTLYYYDQSGNLVRTVPPSGVKPLSTEQTTKAVAAMKSGSSTVLTEHDYTTTYAYNSLNQLVHQDIPDHERIDLWQTAAGTANLNGGNVAGLAYSPAGNSGLMIANTTEKAQLFSTADAGKTWQNNQDIGLGKITAISRVASSAVVYAGGEKGTFLRSDNGGRSWTLLPLTTQSTVKQVYFTAAGTGWIITQDGNQYTSPDAGKTWQIKAPLKGSVGTGTILDAAVNKTNGSIWVLASSGKIYQSTNGGDLWTERTIESPAVTTVALNGTELVAAGPKGTLFKAASATNVKVERTGLDKTISKLLPLGGNTYYALTGDGLVYYSSTPQIWTQVSGLSNTTAIVKENGYVLAYDASGLYKLTGATASVLSFKRVRSYAGGYVGQTPVNAVALLDNNLNITGGFTTSGIDITTIKDMYVIGTKLILLATDNRVHEGILNGTVMEFNTGAPKHTNISSFIVQGGDLYVRTMATPNTIVAYGSSTASVTLTPNVTDIILSSANSGYAVESGKVKPITAGAVSTSVTTVLIPTALGTLTADGTKAYAAGSNGELYVSSGTTFTYVPVVSSQAAFTDAAYSAVQGRLELITTDSRVSYDETTTLLTTSTGYSDALQVSTTPAAGQVLVAAATGSPVTGQTTSSVEGNSSDTYLAGGNSGKIWYKESSAAAYVAATINIQPLASIAYADANTVLGVGKQGTVLRSGDAGTSWQMVYAGTGNDLSQVSAQGNTAAAIGTANTVLYSTNGGQSWSAAGGTITAPTSVKVTQNVILITAGPAVYKSVNSGQNFSAESGITSVGTLRSVWLDNDGYGYVVGDAGSAYRITPGSTATTFTYTKIETDATPDDDKGTGIPVAALKTVQFSDRLTGYITASNGLVLKTVDGGARWKKETAGTGTGTPQLALSSDARRGTLIGADGSVQTLNDQAEQFNSRFWYDELGRLVLSQNSKQFTIANYESSVLLADPAVKTQGGTVRAYSYTLYDAIGRITEVGELLTDKPVVSYKNESQVQYAVHAAYAGSGYKHQVSKTTYDRNDVAPAGFVPTYLRNRVAYTTYKQTPTSPTQATHYSYDVHGNVNSLLQLITHDGNVLAKTVDYEYDLISGKVNKVYYQKGQKDQLIHAYKYDGDNRITEVKTSTDNRIFTKDASYEYYAHGPLARTKLGELNAETQNYAYTIQGWIKQMQAEAFSYALGYNEKDYSSIGAATILATPIATANSKSQGLYNGNIASMTSNTPKMTEVDGQQAILQQQYSYDQLNRITASTTPGAGNRFKTSYSYDANGNIKTLARYDASSTRFDTLLYNYETKAKGYQHTTNKLRWVDDATPTSATALTTSDIEDQSNDNYSYDAIGNLIKDNQEQIDTISWTVSGKVRRVSRTAASNKPDLEFEYDASGQRIVKKVLHKDGSISSTYYLRDASGNVMSVYEYSSVNDNAPVLAEQYIYGSSRIGVYKPEANVLSQTHVAGKKSYELSDHLGNVRATLSDYRRLASHQQIVKSASDYYPFGMGMVGRQVVSNNGYRYGFNGKELDTEGMGGSGATYDYGFRIYNPNIAKFLSIDPLMKSYPWYTPYQFASNSPIVAIDIDGLEGTKSTAPPKFWSVLLAPAKAAVINKSYATSSLVLGQEVFMNGKTYRVTNISTSENTYSYFLNGQNQNVYLVANLARGEYVDFQLTTLKNAADYSAFMNYYPGYISLRKTKPYIQSLRIYQEPGVAVEFTEVVPKILRTFESITTTTTTAATSNSVDVPETVISKSPVVFDKTKSVLSDAAKAQLDNVAKNLLDGQSINVIGYSATGTASDDDNVKYKNGDSMGFTHKQLKSDRANAMKAYLVNTYPELAGRVNAQYMPGSTSAMSGEIQVVTPASTTTTITPGTSTSNTTTTQTDTVVGTW